MSELERDFRREQTECYGTICSSKSYTIILVKQITAVKENACMTRNRKAKSNMLRIMLFLTEIKSSENLVSQNIASTRRLSTESQILNIANVIEVILSSLDRGDFK